MTPIPPAYLSALSITVMFCVYVTATRTEHVVFGDCHIGQQYQVTFTMTNRSLTDTMRFEWPQEAPLNFSPQV